MPDPTPTPPAPTSTPAPSAVASLLSHVQSTVDLLGHQLRSIGDQAGHASHDAIATVSALAGRLSVLERQLADLASGEAVAVSAQLGEILAAKASDAFDAAKAAFIAELPIVIAEARKAAPELIALGVKVAAEGATVAI